MKMKNETISADEIYLAPETEQFEEATQIAQATIEDDKYDFYLQYDANQRDFLLSLLEAVGAIVKDDDEEGNTLSTQMNMTQLAFLKRRDCVEKVKTDEGINPFLAEEAEKNQQNGEVSDLSIENDATQTEQTVAFMVDNETVATAMEDNISTAIAEEQTQDSGVAVTSVTASATGSCCTCPTNTSMESAKEISDDFHTVGRICCPRAEQWFKFTATRTGKYTIYTTGDLDTVGTLYDCCGNKIIMVDDYEPCGKINFRIIQNLTAGNTYYVKVRAIGDATGSYLLYVTEKVLANSVSINKGTITLEKGVTYELPITPNYTYKGYNGAQPIPGLSVSIHPSNASEQKIYWWEQYGDVLDCTYGYDDDGDRYIHITATGIGTAKLFAEDWKENGRRDECTVNVDNMLIYRTRNRERLGFYDQSNSNDINPIIAEDLTYGGKCTDTLVTNGTGIGMSDLNNYNSIPQRVTVIKNFFNSQVNYDEIFMNILSDMVDHFVDGTGTDYSNDDLTSAVRSHSRTTSYVNAVINLVNDYIAKNRTTISNLAYDEDLWTQPTKRATHPLVNAMNTAISNGATELYLPSYGYDNGVPGLTLAIDGFYGNKIRIKDFQSTESTYSATLEFTFYDHFGLDTLDLTKERFHNLTAGMAPGFRQWFILQHWSDLEGEIQPKPFVTNVSFSVPISGTYQ